MNLLRISTRVEQMLSLHVPYLMNVHLSHLMAMQELWQKKFKENTTHMLVPRGVS